MYCGRASGVSLLMLFSDACFVQVNNIIEPLTNCPLCVQECRPCHSECIGCEGPSSGLCKACANYKQEDRCVALCSSDYYIDDETTKTCAECDRQCLRCHGPTAADCTSCRYLKLYHNLEDRNPDSPVCCYPHYLYCSYL